MQAADKNKHEKGFLLSLIFREMLIDPSDFLVHQISRHKRGLKSPVLVKRYRNKYVHIYLSYY